MKRVHRLIRGGKHERVAPVATDRDNVWQILPGGNSSFHEGDVVCARRPVSIKRASRKVASWRTRVTPMDLVLLRPAGGWSEASHGAGEPVVTPYTQLMDQGLQPDPAA